MGDGQKYYMRAEHVVAASMALSALDIVAVALRFWARKLQRQPPKADDWLMIPATVGKPTHSQVSSYILTFMRSLLLLESALIKPMVFRKRDLDIGPRYQQDIQEIY